MYNCKVCPPDAPLSAACVHQIELRVENVDDDLRILRNGNVIRNKNHTDRGLWIDTLTTSKYGFQQGDEITVEVWTGGNTYSYGSLSAIVTYLRGEQKHELKFDNGVVKSDEPIIPEQEYYEIVRFTI
jgi:hypothetical protein